MPALTAGKDPNAGPVRGPVAAALLLALAAEAPAQCLTPKLSRPAQWSGPGGKLYLPPGPRNEAGSA
jgi:hypothetical protein